MGFGFRLKTAILTDSFHNAPRWSVANCYRLGIEGETFPSPNSQFSICTHSSS